MKLLRTFLFFFFFSDDESGEKSVSVLLAGEESELIFIDFATADLSVSVSQYSLLYTTNPINETENETFSLLPFTRVIAIYHCDVIHFESSIRYLKSSIHHYIYVYIYTGAFEIKLEIYVSMLFFYWDKKTVNLFIWDLLHVLRFRL